MGLALLANVDRVRAYRILDMAMAISVAVDGKKAGALLKAVGADPAAIDAQVVRSEIQEWTDAGRDRLQSKFGAG